MHVDRALLDVYVRSPDPVEQLRTTVHTVRVCHQELEQSVLGRPEPYFIAIGADPMAGRIQRKHARAHRLVVVRTRAPQNGLDSRHEFARGERLRNVIVGATVQTGDFVILICPRRQHDDSEVIVFLVALEHAGQFEPAHVGQHPVDQGQIRPLVDQ